MAHSFRFNFGHLIFHVGSIAMRPADLVRIQAYLRTIAAELGVTSIVIGGMEDHVHLLGNFPVTRALCDVVKKVKAGSSHWIPQLHSRYAHFSWQTGYGYFSVSATLFSKVADYIIHQREHHAHMTAQEEYEHLVRKYSRESLGE